jgi:hypothetical protein
MVGFAALANKLPGINWQARMAVPAQANIASNLIFCLI